MALLAEEPGGGCLPASPGAQACRYTLDICALVLHWNLGDLLQKEQHDYQLLVLTICNNAVSEPWPGGRSLGGGGLQSPSAKQARDQRA